MLTAFADRAALMQAAADQLKTALEAGIKARGRGAVALSGGGTPAPAYEALAGRDLDWPRVTFALVDERFVPVSDPGSNEAMLRRTLAPALAKGAALLPLWSGSGAPQAAADQAEQAYAALTIDLALMGMGADAHTASWFPNMAGIAQALDPANPRAVLAVEAPGAAGAAHRLTMSYAAIARAHRLLLLITGEDKRARLEAAKREAPAHAPVAALLAGGKLETFWAP